MPERADASYALTQLSNMRPGEEAFRATLFAGVYPPDRTMHAAARIALSEGGVFRPHLEKSATVFQAATARGVIVKRLCVLPWLGNGYTPTDVNAARLTAFTIAQTFGEEVRVIEYEAATAMLAHDPHAQDSELVQRWQNGVESGHPSASFWSFYTANGQAGPPSLEHIGLSSYGTDDIFLGYEVYNQPIPPEVTWYNGFWRGAFDKAEVLYRPE